MNASGSILWRRLDRPGHEYARIIRDESSRTLSGTALFDHEGVPVKLDYVVTCDLSWSTTAARVWGWLGEREVQVSITAERDRSWNLNGMSCPEVRECTDVDLNFSPSTNLLPIRRLSLAVGQQCEVHAAWLRFPTFTLERLRQIYTRVGELTYRYESAGGAFVAELQVNEIGLPVSYGNIWSAEAAA